MEDLNTSAGRRRPQKATLKQNFLDHAELWVLVTLSGVTTNTNELLGKGIRRGLLPRLMEQPSTIPMTQSRDEEHAVQLSKEAIKFFDAGQAEVG